MKRIKIIQLFDTYGDFYQPYIPPVIKFLRKKPGFDIQIDAFKGEASSDVQIIPSYIRRRFKERFLAISNSSPIKSKYLQRKYLNSNVDIIHLQHSYLFSQIRGLLSMPKSERPKIVITHRGADTYTKPWVDEGWRSFYKGSGQKTI